MTPAQLAFIATTSGLGTVIILLEILATKITSTHRGLGFVTGAVITIPYDLMFKHIILGASNPELTATPIIMLGLFTFCAIGIRLQNPKPSSTTA